MTELHRAVDRLRSARRRTVAVAADWQALDIDTSRLTPALVELQEAIAEVEAVTRLDAGVQVPPLGATPDGVRPIRIAGGCPAA